MYLFESHEACGTKHALPEYGDPGAKLAFLPRQLLDRLTGEEAPGRMLLESSLLVLLLHVWALGYGLGPAEPITAAVPQVMQVSLLAAPATKSPVLVPLPSTAKPAPATKKTNPKSFNLKNKPLFPKPVVTRQPEPPAKRSVEKTGDTRSPAPTTAKNPATANKTPTPKTELFTKANFSANYEFNPKPVYPSLARNRGWQGKVLLRVQVSVVGASEQVSVHRSSGHEILDEAAIEAVEKWRFIPAKHGETQVASSVIVPILFTLYN